MAYLAPVTANYPAHITKKCCIVQERSDSNSYELKPPVRAAATAAIADILSDVASGEESASWNGGLGRVFDPGSDWLKPHSSWLWLFFLESGIAVAGEAS
jgi:hypothetical protein